MKINMQKPVAYFYNNSNISEKEIRKLSNFNSIKNNKILRNKFNHEDKNLYTKK